MVEGYNLYNIEPKFKNFLRAGNISADTLKNYLSDIRHFTGWLSANSKPDIKPLSESLSQSTVEGYKEYLKSNSVPAITINRRLSSLRKFFDFLIDEAMISINTARLVHNIQKAPKVNEIKQLEDHLEDVPSESVENQSHEVQMTGLLKKLLYTNFPFKIIAIGIVTFFLIYNASSIIVKRISQSKNPATVAVQQTRGRILTFRGKLFDSLGNPISSKTDVKFNIYASESSTAPLYSGSCIGVNGVVPETDGQASVVLGKDCDMKPIPQTVFSNNPGLYLGVTIGSDKELKPRQQIANVSYSLDSEKLQGLDIGNSANSIPYIDENNSITFGASESSIRSTDADGLFSVISDGSLSLESGDQGDITLTSGLSGSLKFKTGGFADSISNLFIGTDGNVGIGTEDPSNFKVQIAGDVGPNGTDTFNLGSETNQWANVYSSKFLQNGVALCDQQGNNCPKNISSWTLSSPYLYTNEKNIRVGIGTSNTSSIISKLFVTKDLNDTATGKALAIFDQTENQDIITASASGQTRFVVKNNGNTGIGTINPSARLDVSGGQTKIEVSTQYTERLCHNGVDGSSTQNVLLGDCSSNGADLAEYYGSTDKSIEAGDIVIAKNGAVMVGKDSKAYVEKSNRTYDSRVIGIVSTNPYDSFGKNFSADEYIIPVALSGRVPLKISKNSPAIKAGDLITSSEEKGLGMKAQKAGQIIGKALENWTPDSNKNTILVFVNISWNDPGLIVPASSGELLSANQSSTYIYSGIIEKDQNQIKLFDKLMARATEEEKNLLRFLWQTKTFTANKTGDFWDISYSMAQNSIEKTALKIQNLLVSEKIISPVIETTDLIASGSSRLSELHTNSIKTDGNNIEIDLEEAISSSESASTGKLAELIIKGANGRRAAGIDAQGNATFSGELAANSASISGQLIAGAVNSDTITTNDLNSNTASISGTLIAKEIQSDTIRALEQRINSLADSSKQNSSLPATSSANLASASNSASIASNTISPSTNNESTSESIDTKEIQKLIAQLKNDALADPEYYHIPDTIQKSSTNISNSPTSLEKEMEKLQLGDLTVTGNVNFYKLNVAESIAVGNMVIENDTILSLANNLNITALSTISLFDGAITIARDGTMTTKGAIIARGGIKTDSIEAIDKNVVVKLANRDDSKVVIANTAGTEVASIDASGSAQFDEISVSKYMEATDSAALISPKDNLEKNGLYAPAFDAERKTAGNGLLPQDASEVIIYTDKIKEGSLVYLTPAENIAEGQLSILEKKICNEESDEDCKPYFRVAISKALHPQLMFNWLIIN